jgi:hypothetical protein
MEKGDKVMIFEDPATREKEEGEAILERNMLHSDPELGERWMVRFVGSEDEGAFSRWVWKP